MKTFEYQDRLSPYSVEGDRDSLNRKATINLRLNRTTLRLNPDRQKSDYAFLKRAVRARTDGRDSKARILSMSSRARAFSTVFH